MAVRIRAPARLHFGFQNLSLAHERLYGGIGAAVSEPAEEITVERAPEVDIDMAGYRELAEQITELLSVPGIRMTVHEQIPNHVGLGSGTQRSLAVLAGTAAAYDRDVPIRSIAPQLGRGGRSGIGVASFESGGFVMDGGHPVEAFTTTPPDEGAWTVPPIIARHAIPEAWRFVIITPAIRKGRHGPIEETAMRSLIEQANPTIAEDIARICLHRLLPAIAEGHLPDFGSAVTKIGRLNGAWYADLQGGIYRDSIGPLVRSIVDAAEFEGAGQSSWGPTVFGMTDTTRVKAARRAAENALESTIGEGSITVLEPRNSGASIDPIS